jgi:hypothetical protein
MDCYLVHGDCLETLKQMESDTLDSLVTDPPAGISFMGKEWDNDKGGRKQWIAWLSDVMKECLRVMKPGAHGLIWAIPRTSHWTATALEDAGFEVRDVITHLFGTGFPKSMDISKAIDKAAGHKIETDYIPQESNDVFGQGKGKAAGVDRTPGANLSAKGITPEAKQWQGWGTALKPASEHWILVRKPIAEKTVAANVLKHGTGGINIDASRIAADFKNDPNFRDAHNHKGHGHTFGNSGEGRSKEDLPDMGFHNSKGRFPANLILSHNPDCEETCTEGCAVAELDKQSLAGGMHSAGKARDGSSNPRDRNHNPSSFTLPGSTGDMFRLGDSGGASRFFYVAKASKREKNAGCEGLPEKKWKDHGFRDNDSTHLSPRAGANRSGQPVANHHPTVKPLKLMSYLIKMITPPNGIVLDPFMGSGSTGVAALKVGARFVGIEKDPEYIRIAHTRMELADAKD